MCRASAFTGTGDLSVSGNAGNFAITTTGTGNGIYIVSSSGFASASYTGNINSEADGILVSGTTLGEVIYSGDINSDGHAINTNASAGTISITTTGNLHLDHGRRHLRHGGRHWQRHHDRCHGRYHERPNFSAIFAGADADGGNINVTVNAASSIMGGSAGGAVGVRMSGGASNLLTNAGTIQALSGFAIAGDTGSDSVANSGLVIGNVDLGTGANAFSNTAVGELRSGMDLNVGNGNSVLNAGVLSPGGLNTVVHTGIAGSLVQTPLTGNTVSISTPRRERATGSARLTLFALAGTRLFPMCLTARR